MHDDNTLALAQQHNEEVHRRVMQRMTGVRLLMADFRYWVYKLDDPLERADDGPETLFCPRRGWSGDECVMLIKNTVYPSTVEEMQAAIEAAKLEEQQSDCKRMDTHEG